MYNKYLQIIQTTLNDQYALLKIKIKELTGKVKAWVEKYWFKGVMLGILVWMLAIKDVSIHLNLQAIEKHSVQPISSSNATNAATFNVAKTGVLNNSAPAKVKKVNSKKTSIKVGNEMNTYSNLPFDGSPKKISDSAKKRAAKRKKQLAYIKKYKKLAKKEMKLYGVPASITLAQGLLESNVGDSRLAKNNNNHFGMKCFSRKCKKGHCSNFTDDSHKDFFRKYKSVADSFRAHSKLLKNGKRYRSLFKLEKTDYTAWAKGLRKAGYATDKRYHVKLIALIENLDLNKYD